MAPFELTTVLGKFGGYLVYLLIGIGFGAVLEMSGFGDSRKLSAQFYLKDMTVLKVMFTAIIVAMVLIFAFFNIGLVDFNRLYVNPTYLWPGIIGGLIMGVGFIIGGFCPGTSLVGMATLKIDGAVFVGGVAFGIFVFGETVPLFETFQNSSSLGRFILPELFGVSNGWVVFGVVLMALVMFYFGEVAEKFFGMKMKFKEIIHQPFSIGKVIASAVLVFGALFVLVAGQPSPEDLWNRIKTKENVKLENRSVFLHPGEVVEIMNDPMRYTTLLDFRNETDFNLFHLENARRVDMAKVYDIAFIKQLTDAPANTIVVVMSNDETDAAQAYRLLKAQGVLNLYILGGGVNRWLEVFPVDSSVATKNGNIPAKASSDRLRYVFFKAVGQTVKVSNPGIEYLKEKGITFTRKVSLQKKKVISGGCG